MVLCGGDILGREKEGGEEGGVGEGEGEEEEEFCNSLIGDNQAL